MLLVSAPHMLSGLHAGYLSYGVPKQVIGMTIIFNLSWVAENGNRLPQRHAELVSAPHMLSGLHAGYLSYGVPKQVIGMTIILTCHGQRYRRISSTPCIAAIKAGE